MPAASEARYTLEIVLGHGDRGVRREVLLPASKLWRSIRAYICRQICQLGYSVASSARSRLSEGTVGCSRCSEMAVNV